MNVRLDSVISDITGQIGMKILRAIIDGERDPRRLASFRHRRIKAGENRIAASLEGTWREEHLFALEQAMQRYDFLDRQLEDCEARIAEQIDDLTPSDRSEDDGAADETPLPEADDAASNTASHRGGGRKRAVTTALAHMMGAELTAIPTIGTGIALTIVSEIGPDFSAFPSAQHFCSWLGVAPGIRISGGKPLPGRAQKAVNPVGQALRMAALSARRSQTFIGAKHRARLARKDAPVAITATARELACLIYLMVTRGEEHVEKGVEAFEKRRIDRALTNLHRQARALGYQPVQPAEDQEVPKDGMAMA